MMGFIHNFGNRSHIEVNVGGRIHVYLAEFQRFINQLKMAGATLVFICDGHLRTDRLETWCIRREKEFRTSYEMVTANTDLCWRNSLGCKAICTSLFKFIEDERLGEIIISTHVECDAIVANYANSHNALAVVGNDSDALIYEGNFYWWQSTTLNMEQCTVRSFDRAVLRKFLNLSHTQMKYLATIAGNDYSRKMELKPGSFMPHNEKFIGIAKFCRSLTSDKDVCMKIACYMRCNERSVQDNDLECIRISIDSYSIDVEQPEITDRMEKFYQHNVLLYAMKNQATLQIDVNFLDFVQRVKNTEKQTFIDSIVGVCRRIAGIILSNDQAKHPIVKICTKWARNEDYAVKNLDPIYPDAIELFDYEDIICSSSRSVDTVRWDLLFWTLDLDSHDDFMMQMRNIPHKYYIAIIALQLLVAVIID